MTLSLPLPPILLSLLPLSLPFLITISFTVPPPLPGLRPPRQLTCHVDPDVPLVVLGDSVRVRQVLLNLLSNALKFTKEGSVRVRVSLIDPNAVRSGGGRRRESFTGIVPLREADVDKVLVQYEVEDTGIGIAPEAQAKLFQAFTQVGGEGEGAGMGRCGHDGRG